MTGGDNAGTISKDLHIKRLILKLHTTLGSAGSVPSYNMQASALKASAFRFSYCTTSCFAYWGIRYEEDPGKAPQNFKTAQRIRAVVAVKVPGSQDGGRAWEVSSLGGVIWWYARCFCKMFIGS